MTIEEIKERYGDVEVRFSGCYKYVFTFRNEVQDITVSIGGDADDIYRLSVEASKNYTIAELIHEADITWMKVKEEEVYYGY